MQEDHFYRCKVRRIDPLGCDVDLPLNGMFFPAGFPLSLSTNSADVIESAGESWGAWGKGFETPPLRFRVVVEREGEAAAAPSYRKQGSLLSFVSDAHNFACGDTDTLEASFHLSEKTAADHMLLRWLYLDAMAYMLLTTRFVVALHAACVAREGRGILLCGRSGSGKSTLSVACARAGFTFVSDDCTWIRTGTSDLEGIGKPHQARLRGDAARHFAELEGFPVRTLPNGKVSMEPSITAFGRVDTAGRVPIAALVFLQRVLECDPGKEAVSGAEASALLLEDLPSYGPEVNAAHEDVVQRLCRLPAYRLTYRNFEDAIALLREI